MQNKQKIPKLQHSTILPATTYYRLRALVDTYMQVQKIRVASNNRINAMFRKQDEYHSFREELLEILMSLEKVEVSLQDKMLIVLHDIDVYTQFLSNIKGLGPVLSAKLLSVPFKFPAKITDWYSYAGLVPFYFKCICKNNHKFLFPKKDTIVCLICGTKSMKKLEFVNEAPRRITGYKTFWSSYARTTMWLIARSFMLGGKFYKAVYKHAKEVYSKRHPDKHTRHITGMALRYAVKLFLSHFHEAAHKLHNEKYTLPYQFVKLSSHGDYISYAEVLLFEKNKDVSVTDIQEYISSKLLNQ